MNYFDPKEVFLVNDELKVQTIKLGGADTVLIIDNFYQYPEKISEIVRKSPAPMWKNQDETRNFKEYYDCRHQWVFWDDPEFLDIFIKLAEHYYDVKASVPPDQTFATNCFQWIEDQPFGVVGNKSHADGPDKIAFNVFFNKEEECHGGTAIYRSKVSGSYRFSNDFDYMENIEELYEDGTSYYDPKWQEYWTVEHVLEMKYNRCVVYPGYIYHGAFHIENNFKNFPRITQTYFLKLTEDLEIPKL